jgi:predicted nucleic acid-binding protein
VIFLDSNVIIRYLLGPVDKGAEKNAAAAKRLIDAVERGDAVVTTTEVVLHEVAYVLTSKKEYDLPSADVAALLATLLRMPNVRFPRGDKQRFLRALDLWATHPNLGLADCIVATTAILRDAELATFDRGFDRLPGLKRWQPPAKT